MSFRVCLAGSLLLHLMAAVVLKAWLGAANRQHEGYLIIDLTSSFRTGTPVGAAHGPQRVETADRTEPVPDDEEVVITERFAARKASGGEAVAALHQITSLPKIKHHDELREKLARYYPPAARDQGMEGVVLLEVVISSRGRIAEAKVVKAEPPLFAKAAVKACRELAFIPAYLGFTPVAVRIRLPIRFH